MSEANSACLLQTHYNRRRLPMLRKSTIARRGGRSGATKRLRAIPSRTSRRVLWAPLSVECPVHARITQLVAAGAWTDAALALIELELPEWSLRRLAYDDGEWHCSLSRNRAIPLEFDDSADGRDELLPVAIVNAFLEARRPRAVTAHSRAMRPAN